MAISRNKRPRTLSSKWVNNNGELHRNHIKEVQPLFAFFLFMPKPEKQDDQLIKLKQL